MTSFAAIDFETANYAQNSACALGLVVVEDGRIVRRLHALIRPPSRQFVFTYIHGLTWRDVEEAPDFAEVWAAMADELRGVRFLAAHNAPFDRGVLGACCATYGLAMPPQPFVCTVQLARARWNIRPTRLPDVCRRLGIILQHHQADSDAEACARIVIAALDSGWRGPAPTKP
ncbi:MAG: exonuclease [Desulfobulbaceae bacterium A2]|nr:MAG: exonuclease [Desulfobulbaceae bacterium A2]